jgi:hypothetical protein
VLLGTLFGSLINVGPDARAPLPPVDAGFSWSAASAAALIATTSAAALVMIMTRRAFRGREVGRLSA